MSGVATTLLLGTGNAGKGREFLRWLGVEAPELAVSVLTLVDLQTSPAAPIEDGQSFLENARKKALGYAAATGMLTLADDSGLAVEALGGRPGIHSARYAGPEASDRDNVAQLLRELAETAPSERGASFRCALVLADATGVLAQAEGAVHGLIAEAASGTEGFGYDPVFFHPPSRRTFAELSRDEKSALSHRGEGLRQLLPALRQHCAPGGASGGGR